ncbi:hypothetical protein E2C01_028674 [Portunus trituberculatus]|uniref:Uncharacterized protein n=1 Tax=Portunus trituberculatus TaxID=210409 RepID=A0A5B7EPC5_PORTR|nr:hypothetical protein [Portunus trituberculatus]
MVVVAVIRDTQWIENAAAVKVLSSVATRWRGTTKVGRLSLALARELSCLLESYYCVWSTTHGSWVYLADVQESIRCGGYQN